MQSRVAPEAVVGDGCEFSLVAVRGWAGLKKWNSGAYHVANGRAKDVDYFWTLVEGLGAVKEDTGALVDYEESCFCQMSVPREDHHLVTYPDGESTSHLGYSTRAPSDTCEPPTDQAYFAPISWETT